MEKSNQSLAKILSTSGEAVDLGSQLPMLVRGFYYEGWKPSKTPQEMSTEEFFDQVQSQFQYTTEYSIKELIQGTMKALSKYVSQGELEDIKASLPKDLSSIISAK